LLAGLSVHEFSGSLLELVSDVEERRKPVVQVDLMLLAYGGFQPDMSL
jgi:hypothetical protein